MRVYNLTSDSYLVLDSVKTKNGFKHEATLVRKTFEDVKVKINYINRTWESFEFESVIKKLFDKMKYNESEKEAIINKIKNGEIK
jgi:hypothetical protein